MTVLEFVFGSDLGIDQLVVKQSLRGVAGPPGRMALTAAVSFVLIGAALGLLAWKKPRFWRLAAELLALGVSPLVLLGLLGHVYGVPRLGGLGIDIELAQAAVFVLALLTVGIILAIPGSQTVALLASERAGGVLARRLIPLAILVPIVFGWLRLQGQRAGYYGVETGLALLVASLIGIFVAAIALAARRLEALDAARRHEEREVSALNAQLEQRVAQRTAELETTNQELEQFAYSVSHDLRAPLRAVDGFSKVLLDDYREQLGEEGRRYLGRVRAGAVRMGNLIDAILQLSRLSRRPFVRVPVDLSALAREVVAELEDGDPAGRVQVAIQDGLLAEADRALVEDVLQNLLANAYKFTAKTASPMIRFGAVEQGGVPVYFVADNGAGFDMAHADQLFRPFHRLHRETEFPGDGIGLATVVRAVHRHDGVVWAQGAVNQGATFHFSLTPGAHPPASAATGEDVIPTSRPAEGEEHR